MDKLTCSSCEKEFNENDKVYVDESRIEVYHFPECIPGELTTINELCFDMYGKV